MFNLTSLTDEEIQDKISRCLDILQTNVGSFNTWFLELQADVAMVYQNEIKRRQTERAIRATEELTDVIRRKKIIGSLEPLIKEGV